ncbi:MAG: hypothetical protein QM765_39585 [Myxococcales bacterium]
MTPRELRRALREQRAELRRSLVEAKSQARAQVDQVPQVKRERRRRTLRRVLALVLLALLLSLLHCDCQPPPTPVVASEPAPGPDAAVRPPVVTKAKPKPLRAQVSPVSRPAFEPVSAPPAAWVQELRLQVAARSPRLAECFTGAQGPGALRWAASINPQSGVVSDHELVTVGTGEQLPRDQRECLIKVLSAPPYRLSASAGTAPDRVGMVIEF